MHKIALFAVAAVIPFAARADVSTQPVGTVGNESAWSVSLPGAAGYAPFQAMVLPGVSAIGVQQDLKGLKANGDPEPAIGGVDLSNWNGMWEANYNFYIPGWAGDMHFHLNALAVDDKAAIFVDNFLLGFFALNDKTGPGTFQFDNNPDNVADVNYISSQNFPSWGWDKELTTGWNSIRVFLDNTDDNQDLSALSEPNLGAKLYTYLSLDATVTYVPEPGSFWMLLGATALLAGVHGWRRRPWQSKS